jgi:hypothetical protein
MAATLALLSFFMLVAGIGDWLKSGLERLRVATFYLKGKGIDRRILTYPGVVPSAALLEDVKVGRRSTGRGVRRHLQMDIVALALSPWYLLTYSGAAFYATGNWLTVLQGAFGAGLFVALILPQALMLVRGGFAFEFVPDDWVHPRPPAPAEQIQAEIEAAQQSVSPSPRRGRRRIFRHGR